MSKIDLKPGLSAGLWALRCRWRFHIDGDFRSRGSFDPRDNLKPTCNGKKGVLLFIPTLLHPGYEVLQNVRIYDIGF